MGVEWSLSIILVSVSKGLFQMDPPAAKEHTGMMNSVLEMINPFLHLISGRCRIYREFDSLCLSISEPFTSCWRDHPLPLEKFIETMKHLILIGEKLVGIDLPCSTWKSVQDAAVGGVMKTGNMISTNPGLTGLILNSKLLFLLAICTWIIGRTQTGNSSPCNCRADCRLWKDRLEGFWFRKLYSVPLHYDIWGHVGRLNDKS